MQEVRTGYPKRPKNLFLRRDHCNNNVYISESKISSILEIQKLEMIKIKCSFLT